MNLNSSQNLATQEDKYILNQVPAEYSIPLESFNELLNSILGLSRTKESTVDFLKEMAFAKSLPDKVLKILWEKSFSEEQFLERTQVMKRRETEQKKKDLHVLMSRAKKAFPEDFLTESEKLKKLIQIYKENFKKHSNYNMVYYSDGSLNFIESLNNTNKEEERIIRKEQWAKQLNQKRIDKTAERQSNLQKSDFQRLKDSVFVALRLKNQLTKQDWLHTFESFLENEFNEKKMRSEIAIQYFAREYFRALIAQKEELKEELYPNDRTIVEIMLKTKTNEPVCKVRGEKSIISTVIKVLNQSWVSLDKVPETDEARKEIQIKIQKWIDSYYEVLKEYEIRAHNEAWKISWNKFDLEDLGNLFRFEDWEIQNYTDEEINLLLNKNLKKKNILNEKNTDQQKEFNWYESFVKEIITFQPTLKQRTISKIDVFRKLGFNYLSSDEAISWKWQLWITLRKRPKNITIRAKKIMA